MKVFKNLFYTILCVLALTMTGCTYSDDINETTDLPVAFTSRMGGMGATRADNPGPMNDSRLQGTGFAVFAYYTGEAGWSEATSELATTIPNFMYNQKVTYNTTDKVWTYTPIKYWPNDNKPADDEGATGSKEHSYLQFFAYAPYVEVSDPDAGLDLTSDDTADGIVEIKSNSTQASDNYLRYRTSHTKPFGESESVDLLWAAQRDRYKMDGGGYTTGHVDFVFKHALTKVSLFAKALIDRTSQYTSPAYPTTLDKNSRIFIESVDITTPPYYSEGKLMLAHDGDAPKWNFDGIASGKKKDGFHLDNKTGNDIDDISYSLRWNGKPKHYEDVDKAEEAKKDFDKLLAGVTDEEQQLPADYPIYLFPPSEEKYEISVHAVYYVVTYDPSLTLNKPRFYSIVKNDITASLGNSDFLFEPNKQYKIVLNLGLTSVKFDISVLDDSGEWILLSAVVKEWDLETIETDVQ